MFKCFVCWKNVMLEISVCQNIVCCNVGYTEIMLYFNICMSYWCIFDYLCVQMVYTEILVFQNRVISKNVYEIVHVCPPHTAHYFIFNQLDSFFFCKTAICEEWAICLCAYRVSPPLHLLYFSWALRLIKLSIWRKLSREM